MKILKKRMSEVLNELTKDKGVRRTAPYTESGIITNKYIYFKEKRIIVHSVVTSKK